VEPQEPQAPQELVPLAQLVPLEYKAQLVQELQAPLASLVKRGPLVRLAPSGLLVPLELLAW
jgi:hypothetical protein